MTSEHHVQPETQHWRISLVTIIVPTTRVPQIRSCPPRGWSGAGVGVGMLRGRGTPLGVIQETPKNIKSELLVIQATPRNKCIKESEQKAKCRVSLEWNLKVTSQMKQKTSAEVS